MFVVTENPEFTHDVTVFQPVDDGHKELKLRTRFRVIPLDEVEEFDLSNSQGMLDYLDRVVVRFENLADEEGNAIECDDAKRKQLFMVPYIRVPLVNAYTAAMSKARKGN